jgi:hypothetical protein
MPTEKKRRVQARCQGLGQTCTLCPTGSGKPRFVLDISIELTEKEILQRHQERGGICVDCGSAHCWEALKMLAQARADGSPLRCSSTQQKSWYAWRRTEGVSMESLNHFDI